MSKRERRDRAKGGAALGGIIGGMAGGVPGAVVGSIVGAALGYGDGSATCLRCGGSAYETYSAGGRTGWKCSSCGRFWTSRS